MSPEQARGEAIGPATDIYALGAILYDLLTGRPPYLGHSPVAVLKQVRTQPSTASSSVPIVEKDDKLDAAKRKAEMEFYADEAMKMLRGAVAKGFKDVAHMKKDKDLDALRSRPDFQKLLAELEGKGT